MMTTGKSQRQICFKKNFVDILGTAAFLSVLFLLSATFLRHFGNVFGPFLRHTLNFSDTICNEYEVADEREEKESRSPFPTTPFVQLILVIAVKKQSMDSFDYMMISPRFIPSSIGS
ncbi:hypothetical protein AB6A40_006180 [Gnathostoma spinigerum]|uniref:Uncharacterized protein n=1 Tax=Gnathostoma spinigerum TaxID=75299 RepID=A0ABD6EJQ0_9BILA